MIFLQYPRIKKSEFFRDSVGENNPEPFIYYRVDQEIL